MSKKPNTLPPPQRTPRADPAPSDATTYTLTIVFDTFTSSSTHDTPSDVRDRLAEMRAEGLNIRSFTVSRGTEDDITGEFA